MARLVAKPSFIGLRKGCPSSAGNGLQRNAPSVKQPTRVEVLVCLDLAFSLRRQCPEYLSCECKRAKPFAVITRRSRTAGDDRMHLGRARDKNKSRMI